MKKTKFMNENDYSIFEIDKSLMKVSDYVFQKKWRSIIRSELEKLYPNFDNFTFWFVRDLYNPFAKNILTIVIEPEIYAAYRMQNKITKIIYKGKKYNIGRKVFKLIFSITFLLFFSHFILSALKGKNESSSLYNIPVEKEIVLETSVNETIFLFDFLQYLFETNNNAEIKKISWEKQSSNNENAEILLSKVYPEELSLFLEKQSYENESFKIQKIAYLNNTPQVLLSFFTKTPIEILEEVGIVNMRNIVFQTGGTILSETANVYELSFEIPKHSIVIFSQALQKTLVVVDKLFVEQTESHLLINLRLAKQGIDIGKIISYLKNANTKIPQRTLVEKKITNKPSDAIPVGRIRDDEGRLVEYFRNKENKIFIIKN